MEIENETSKLIAIAITLVGIAFVITMAFGVFGVGKKMANSGQNDLVAQVDQVNTSVYTDLDQQTISGTRLNGIVSQMAGQKCAILIATTPFLNLQAGQATCNGNLGTDIDTKNAGNRVTPMVQSDGGDAAKGTDGAFKVKTSQGTLIDAPIFVNYGAILNNGVTGTNTYSSEAFAAGKDTVEGATHVALPLLGATKYGEATDKNQTIQFKDGTFTTKLEFLTNEGRVQHFENKADLTSSGKTMSITDSSMFESYILKDTAGNYMGLVFAQILK